MTLWVNIRALLAGTLMTESLTLQTISTFMIMACFLGKEVKITRKRVLLLHAFFAFVLCYNLLGFFARLYLPPETDVSGSTFDLTLFFYGYLFVLSLLFYEEKKLIRAIETIVALFLYATYLQQIVINVFGLVVGNPMLVNSTVVNAHTPMSFVFSACVFLLTLAATLTFYFGFYRMELHVRLKFREMIFMALWLMLMLFYSGLATGVYKDEVRMITILIMFPVLSIFLPIFILLNRYRTMLREMNAYQQTYLDAELSYVEQYKKAQTQTRAFRHDVINQLSLLNMLMHEGKTAEAQRQLEEMLGEVQNLSPKYVTGDQMLDCIVAMKAAKMEELGITFTYDGVVDGGLGLKPMEVCGIFANALDNAIEAVSKLEASGEGDGSPARWIDFKIKRTERFFVICIRNAAAGKVNVEKLFEGGYTSKKDAERHGFGLQNIRNAVGRYDGLIKAESEEGSFSLSIMIPRERKKDE